MLISNNDIVHKANLCDGAMAMQFGIAARKSIEEKPAVLISELTST